MNRFLFAKMGIFQSTTSERDNEGDKSDKINLEASPEIKVLIIYEQPQGTGLHMNLTLDPRRSTTSLKSDLSNLTQVPSEHIHLIFKCKTLEDDLPLRDQGVGPSDIIQFRDLRLKYSYP